MLGIGIQGGYKADVAAAMGISLVEEKDNNQIMAPMCLITVKITTKERIRMF